MLKKSFAFILVFVVLLCFSVPAFAAYGVDEVPEPSDSHPYVFYTGNSEHSYAFFTSVPISFDTEDWMADLRAYQFDSNNWRDITAHAFEIFEQVLYFGFTNPDSTYINYDLCDEEGNVVIASKVPSSAVSNDIEFLAVFDALKEQINVKAVVLALGVGVVVPIALAFMWWGVRKLTIFIMIAFKKGKIKI